MNAGEGAGPFDSRMTPSPLREKVKMRVKSFAPAMIAIVNPSEHQWARHQYIIPAGALTVDATAGPAPSSPRGDWSRCTLRLGGPLAP